MNALWAELQDCKSPVGLSLAPKFEGALQELTPFLFAILLD